LQYRARTALGSPESQPNPINSQNWAVDSFCGIMYPLVEPDPDW
jgi:hypothetical protein